MSFPHVASQSPRTATEQQLTEVTRNFRLYDLFQFGKGRVPRALAYVGIHWVSQQNFHFFVFCLNLRFLTIYIVFGLGYKGECFASQSNVPFTVAL